MPRIRTIKPEFWTDDRLVELPFETRLLFIGLWNFADDDGYIEYKPRQIKMRVFPADDVLTEDSLSALCKAGMLTECVSDQGPLLHIVNWRKHQKINRKINTRFTGIVPKNGDDSLSPHGADTEGYVSTHGGKEGKGRERKESATHSSSEIAHAITRPELEYLCNLLADLIAANGSKRPTVGKRWIEACRLLIDSDGKTVQQVEAAIRWSQDDTFWRSNILSMPKLRERYDQLRLAASRHRTEPQLSKAARNAAEYQRIFGGDHEHAGSIQALDAGVRA